MRPGNSSFYDLSRTEPLKRSLRRYLKKSGVGWMLKHRDVVTEWNNAVGEAIAAQTQVTGLRAGVLHVDIFSNALKAELEQFSGDTLVRTLRRAMETEEIRTVRFHLAPAPDELKPPDDPPPAADDDQAL